VAEVDMSPPDITVVVESESGEFQLSGDKEVSDTPLGKAGLLAYFQAGNVVRVPSRWYRLIRMWYAEEPRLKAAITEIGNGEVALSSNSLILVLDESEEAAGRLLQLA